MHGGLKAALPNALKQKRTRFLPLACAFPALPFLLFPACLDEYIEQDNPVRYIDAFVGDAMITENNSGKETKQAFSKEPEHYAFVDGSFNTATSVYGYGGFLVTNGQRHVVQGSGTDPEMAAMRNVAGEVLGSMAAMKLALELGLTELTIYYDYMGIEMWATGQWKRNKQGTIAYYDYVQSIRTMQRWNWN